MTSSAAGAQQRPDLQAVKLSTLKEKTPFDAKDLWRDNPALIMVVRRPGCLLCREEAQDLVDKVRPSLQERGMRSVAVVHQTLGAEDFRDGWWKNDDVYLDQSKALYYFLGKGSLNRMGILHGFLSQAWKNIQRAKDRKIEGNLGGEGTILGGLLIVSNRGVEYEYAEKVWGDHAPIDQVLKVIEKFTKK